MKLVKKKYNSLLIFLLLPFCLAAQFNSNDGFGGRVGLAFTFGKPVNRIGIVLNAFYVKDFMQINAAFRIHHNFSSYGPPLKGREMKMSLGLVAGYGPSSSERPNPFVNAISHHTGRKYAIGYTYNYYWDKIETNQGTGTIALQFNKFRVAVENDLFGNTKGMDKYRTGSFSIAYQRGAQLWEVKSLMWTGDTRGNVRSVLASDYPAPYGYRDISANKYGSYSHGVLALQLHLAVPYGQVLQMGAGIDAEQVRHFIQNKVVHDLPFLPKKWNKAKNQHCPMLDKEGKPYLYQEDQAVRAVALYLNLGLNGSETY